jgi:hypothetical protein
MKKSKSEKKISKVMREYKKGKLPIGKSKKKVKSRKQSYCDSSFRSRKI